MPALTPPPARARARRSRALHRGRIKHSIGTRRGLPRRALRQRFLRPACAARAHHSNTAHSFFDIPRELRNACTVRDFQMPPKPVTLKRCMNICLSISECNGSLDVGMYLCFLDEGTIQGKWTQWLLPTLRPSRGYRHLVHHVITPSSAGFLQYSLLRKYICDVEKYEWSRGSRPRPPKLRCLGHCERGATPRDWELLGVCMPIHTAPAVHGGRRRVDTCSPDPPVMLRSRNDDILPRFVQRSLQNPVIDGSSNHPVLHNGMSIAHLFEALYFCLATGCHEHNCGCPFQYSTVFSAFSHSSFFPCTLESRAP